MNTSKKTIGRLFKSAAFLSLVILIMASCQKEGHTSVSSGTSGLTLVHASPGTVAYDISLNGHRLKISPINYGNYYNYGLVPAGNAEFKISRAGTTLVAAKEIFTLKPNDAYSLYVTDIPSKAGLLLTKDDLSVPAAGKAKLRFINLNPDAGSLNLSFLGDTTTLFAKLPFKSTTDFIQVDPATALKLSENFLLCME